MTDMFLSSEVGFKDQANSHGISSALSHIDRSFDLVLKLKFVDFNWNDLDNGHFENEFLRILAFEAILRDIPLGSFEIESSNVASMFRFLFDFLDMFVFGDHSVESGLVKGPFFISTRSLDKSGEITFGYVDTREPNNFRFSVVDPIVVLHDSSVEVSHPGSEFLFRLRREFGPDSWKETIEKGDCEFIKFGGHTDFTLKSSFEVLKTDTDFFDEFVETFEFLEQHNGSWLEIFTSFFSQHLDIVGRR